MITKLLEREDVNEELELRSSFGFMAYHGGSLEKATDVIAREAAERSNLFPTMALFKAMRIRYILLLHSYLRRKVIYFLFLDHVQIVVTILGYGREHLFYSVLLGGRNRQLADHFTRFFGKHSQIMNLETVLENIPKELRGQHLRNPVNYPPQGRQLELPPLFAGTVMSGGGQIEHRSS